MVWNSNWNLKEVAGRVAILGLALLALLGLLVSRAGRRLAPIRSRIMAQVEPMYRAVLPQQDEIGFEIERVASTSGTAPLWRIDCYDADHTLIADGLWDDRTGRLMAFDQRRVRPDESALPQLPDSVMEQCARDWLVTLHMATWATLVPCDGEACFKLRRYGEDCTLTLNIPNKKSNNKSNQQSNLKTVLWLDSCTGGIVKVWQMY